MPHGGQQENKIETSTEKIIEIEAEINSEIDKFLIIKTEVKAAINTVPSEKYRELLERRYIYGQKWEQIAIDMNYSCRNIWYMHGKALNLVIIS